LRWGFQRYRLPASIFTFKDEGNRLVLDVGTSLTSYLSHPFCAKRTHREPCYTVCVTDIILSHVIPSVPQDPIVSHVIPPLQQDPFVSRVIQSVPQDPAVNHIPSVSQDLTQSHVIPSVPQDPFVSHVIPPLQQDPFVSHVIPSVPQDSIPSHVMLCLFSFDSPIYKNSNNTDQYTRTLKTKAFSASSQKTPSYPRESIIFFF